MRQQHDRFGHSLFNHATTNQDKNQPKSKLNTTIIDCGRDTGDECTNHNPQPRKHGDECTNTHTLVSKL